MAAFRGSDERLDAEIDTVDEVIQVRLRRYAREMAELERERRALAQERARRRGQAAAAVTPEPDPVSAEMRVTE